MKYFLAIILPPLAVLLCGRLGSFILNLVLTLLGWLPGIIHAVLVVQSSDTERRHRETLQALQSGNEHQGQAVKKPSPIIKGLAISSIAMLGLAGVSIIAWNTVQDHPLTRTLPQAAEPQGNPAKQPEPEPGPATPPAFVPEPAARLPSSEQSQLDTLVATIRLFEITPDIIQDARREGNLLTLAAGFSWAARTEKQRLNDLRFTQQRWGEIISPGNWDLAPAQIIDSAGRIVGASASAAAGKTVWVKADLPTTTRKWTNRDGRSILGKVTRLDPVTRKIEIVTAEGKTFPDYDSASLSEEDQRCLFGAESSYLSKPAGN